MSGTAGLDLFYRPSRKFKTTTIRVFFRGSLDESVEEQAILPFLLKRGSSNSPSLRYLSQKLESLYGTGLALDIAKVGEEQVFVLYMDFVNSRYLAREPDILFKCIDLLNDILLKPVLDEGVFPEDIFAQEKRNLGRYVRGIIDDKVTYAHIRLVKEMYRDEPFGKYEWGEPETIDRLDRFIVYRKYRQMLEVFPVEVYVVGDFSEEEERRFPEILLPFENRGKATRPVLPRPRLFRDEGVIVEEQPLEQSKLAIGFRVDTRCGDTDYYALSLYNAILGGGSYSKLFKKVREGAGLAYYAHSSFDKLKGFLYVSAGIDTQNFERVTDLVRQCMEEIADGNISSEEFGNAKRAITTSLRSVEDSPGQLINFDFFARRTGRLKNVRQLIEQIEGLSPEQVAAAAHRIYPGKTFFLKGTGNSHGATED